MVGGGKLTTAQCNFVHQDEIWRDHVRHELIAAKNWPKEWGGLRDEYHLLSKCIGEVRQRRSRKHSREETPLKLPPIKSPKQDISNPFPTVTSKEIGWRSGRPECILEVYGRWGRPKWSIVKQLKWPNDAVP